MKRKLYLAAIAATGVMALPAAAQAQSPYTPIPTCPSGQVNATTAPYYCIPGPTTTAKKAVKSVSLKVKPKVDKKKPYKYKTSGKVKRKSGSKSLKGNLTITVKRKGKTVAKKTLKVSKSGAYKGSVKIKGKKLKGKKGTLKFTARYKGNKSFKAKSSKTVKAKYRK